MGVANRFSIDFTNTTHSSKFRGTGWNFTDNPPGLSENYISLFCP